MSDWTRTFRVLVVATLGVGFSGTSALGQSGQVSWGPWQFRYEVVNRAGISLRNVRFRGKTILDRANMPVIRVKYDGTPPPCGPYADRISGSNLVTDNNCDNGQKVCQRTFSAGGRDWLEVSGRAFIGSYDIIQAWYLARDVGEIQPVMFSRGLQCDGDHQHHAYWQLDFDMDGSANDQAFLHVASLPDVGYGPGWSRYAIEENTRRNPDENPSWFVRDAQTLLGALVRPGPNDGPRDAFSNINAAVRRYRSSEVGPWPPWAFGASGELGYNNGENVVSKDNILWYVAHLWHEVAEGHDEYHSVGPIIRISSEFAPR
jgi:Copper amine oxidase, enzyme domain